MFWRASARLRVSADTGALVQRSDHGGPEETAMDPCLPAKPNRVIGDSSASDFFRRGFRRRPIPVLGRNSVLAFARTELFFGTEKSEGLPVSDDDFRGFLDSQITPRFPDGLTVVKGDGQFTDSEGEIIKEASFILILLYRSKTSETATGGSKAFAAAICASSIRSRCSASTTPLRRGSPSEELTIHNLQIVRRAVVVAELSQVTHAKPGRTTIYKL